MNRDLYSTWLICVIAAVMLYACVKEPPEDCGCGYIDSVIETGDRYIFTIPDECSGRVYQMVWFRAISDPPQIGDRWCKLKELDA